MVRPEHQVGSRVQHAGGNIDLCRANFGDLRMRIRRAPPCQQLMPTSRRDVLVRRRSSRTKEREENSTVPSSILSAANSSSSGNSSGIGSNIALSSSSSPSVSDTFTSNGSCSSTAGHSGEAKDRELCLEEGGGKLRRGRKRRSRNGGRTSQRTVVGVQGKEEPPIARRRE